VSRYDADVRARLSADEQKDLVEYLKSL